MIFKINDVKYYSYPDEWTVSRILNSFKTSIKEIKELLYNYTFRRENENQGFQIEVAKQLENLLKQFFNDKGFNSYTTVPNVRYSSNIELRADVVIKNRDSRKGIYIEIEFRPNEFKDIVKFEIGYNKDRTTLGILIVAQNRNHINPSYTTMPHFDKCKKIIQELKPRCPILVIGIDGKKYK